MGLQPPLHAVDAPPSPQTVGVGDGVPMPGWPVGATEEMADQAAVQAETAEMGQMEAQAAVTVCPRPLLFRELGRGPGTYRPSVRICTTSLLERGGGGARRHAVVEGAAAGSQPAAHRPRWRRCRPKHQARRQSWMVKAGVLAELVGVTRAHTIVGSLATKGLPTSIGPSAVLGPGRAARVESARAGLPTQSRVYGALLCSRTRLPINASLVSAQTGRCQKEARTQEIVSSR